MQIPAIKKLLNHTASQLEEAKVNLLNYETLQIYVDGVDDGEKMTHVCAAIWILDHMKMYGTNINTALRAYTAMVRNAF